MTSELTEIKKIRKSLGLTQFELAKRAGVSQSLIAKIESESLDPTFTNAQKIFSALSELEKKEEIKADEVMNKKIITAESHEDIKSVIAKMKKHGISQIPVVEGSSVVGILSESSLLDAVIENKGKFASDVMDEVPPMVSKNTSIHVVSSLLRHYPLVLVADSGKLAGLVTKADVINRLYGK